MMLLQQNLQSVAGFVTGHNKDCGRGRGAVFPELVRARIEASPRGSLCNVTPCVADTSSAVVC
jgi:hypothetical protein